MSCPREAHSSTTIVSHLVHEAQEDIEKGSYSDSGFSSDYLREDSQVERSKSKKNLSTTSAISPHNPPTITVRLVTTDVDETPIFPVAQSQECHQPTSKTPALPRGDIVHTIATARVPPAPSEDTDFPCNVFLVDAPAPIIRSATPANHPARFDSTVQLAFCASLLPKGNLLLASESSYASTPTSGESKNAWLNAIHEDPLVPTHIRWLISKIVAEFIENASMASAAISEVVILGPFLCREDYRSLLSCLIMRFDMAALLNVDLLRGLVQLVQCTPINYLTDNDLFCVLASFRKRLESTHTSSREHVYQLVFAVSKILEVMVASDFKGQSRQRDHQPLLAVLRGLKGVEDDVLLKFQVDYAYQTLLHLPDDETSCQVFLRRALSILVGVSIISCLFMMDATITLAAVNFLQQVVCNTIGAVYFSIDDHNFQGTTQRASQATERVRRSKKKTWVSTLQAGQIFVREGRLVEFNTLISNAPCRFEVNFLCGVCLILEDIAVGQLWDVTSKFSALDFLGELYKVEAGLKMDVKIQSDIHDFITQFVMDPKAAAFLGYISVESQDNYLKKLFVIPNLMELVKNPFLLTLALKALPSLPVDALHCSDLKSIQQDLYHGFTKEWIRVSKERLNGARLSQEVREVFVELLETDFFWRVKDYSKRLANAIYHRQNGRPVVEYTHKRDKETWKAEFFGGDIERKLLREASPLTRAGMRHWFIHKSLLDFFFSLAIFDPDDCHDDSDDDRDDDCGAGRGNSGDGDDNTFHNSRSGGLHDNGGNSSASSRSSSSSGESGESVGSSDGRGSSSSGGSGSPSGNNDTPGGSSRFPSDSSGSGAGEDGSNGDRDDSQQRKEDFRSKRKTRKNRSRTSITGEHMSKFNFFKEPAVLFFLEMRARTDARFRKLLFLAIEESRLSVGPNLAAANAITILLKSGESFLKVDLDGVYVPYDYMLEKRLESPEQSECLTGSDLVIALSALDVPGPPQMSNIDPQSTPSSLVEPHHPIITQSCTSCPSPITSTPIRSKPLRPSYRFPGVDLPFSTFAVQIKPILGQFGLHPLSEQATVNPYEADRDISNSMTMISRNGEDIRLQPLQRGPTGRILQVKAHYHPQSEQYVVLWDDILELFPDATTVLNGTLVLTWARDAQLNYIMPRCIKYQQGKVLEVVTSQQQLTQENTTKMAATTIPERPIDLLKLPTEAEESKDEDESEDDMQALPHAMRRSWRVLREVDMHSQKMTEVDMHSQKMTEVDMHSQKTTEVGAYSRWGLSRRRRSDSGPPSFQG
ncbi:hypothetical protein EC991_008250, partial [Linnemannia zychae]